MASQSSWYSWRVIASGVVVLSCATQARFVAAEQDLAAEDAYHYTIAGKRDPFLPPFSQSSEDSEATEEPKTPLQRFDIGQLKLVGVIWETDEPRALIEDNSGLGYIVTRGTLIGSRGGTVKMIEPKRIVVEEYETDFFGKRQAQEKELRLTVTGAAQDNTKREKQ
jgi:Tfp pilus assembly protein PilP